MAKKKAIRLPAAPTAERVHAAMRTGDGTLALHYARELTAFAATPEHLALRKRTIATVAVQFIEANKFSEFNRLMTEAATIDGDDPSWKVEQAMLLARGGQTNDALNLIKHDADPRTRLKVLGFAADRAIRRQSREFLPEELHDGFDVVITAFKQHEAGNEAAARETIEAIGLRSAFLEWKMLLRGLMAFTACDDVRAAENFARLDPQRLPARLAQPLRLNTDPAFKATLSPAALSALQAQHLKLTSSPLVAGLRSVAREFGRNKSLIPVFKATEALLPELKKSLPDLVPRLANCLYHVLYRQAEPSDLPRYRKLFGAPAHDPEFYKLQASILTDLHELAQAHLAWKHYESWLSTRTKDWPPAMLTRARAEIWSRMGELAQHAEEASKLPRGLFDLMGQHSEPRKKRSLEPSAEVCFRRALELAPTWSEGTRKLFELLENSGKQTEAESVLRTCLEHQPNDIQPLERLGGLLRSQGRASEAMEVYLKVITLDPLDKENRVEAALAVLGSAREALLAKNPVDASNILSAHILLLEEYGPVLLHALRSVMAVKAGDAEAAQNFAQQAMLQPNARLRGAFYLMVEAQLAKLKPLDKRLANKQFADECAKPATPTESLNLLHAFDIYRQSGVVYTGQKSHEKKFLDLAVSTFELGGPELEFERLAHALVMRKAWKHATKLVDKCLNQFPQNPVFWLETAHISLGKLERPQKTEVLLLRAHMLAQRATDPRHRALLNEIVELEQMLQSANPFRLDGFDFFDED